MTRKTWTVMLTVTLVGIFFSAAAECRGADDPAKVTELFWEAAKSGGAKAAKPYMTRASQVAIDKGTISLKGGGGNLLIGETKIQGNNATVIVTSTEKPDEQVTTVLLKEYGKWKVDLIKTIEGILAASDIGKQMKEMQEKLRGELGEKMSAVMKDNMANMSTLMANGDAQAAATKMAAALAEMMGGAEPKEEIFLLSDMGWGDPFIDPRDRVTGEIAAGSVIPELGDEKKKIWEDALTALSVDVIIGFEDDLAAVVTGVRVRPGDIVTGEKLKFEVLKITSTAVHLRCISEEKDYKKFRGITIKRKISL